MNVLWIMADQLRWDFLSCYGHPHLHTPNIDRLAERGLRFTNAYIQSPICGPSRMSAYTGRYVRSHGSTYNQVPLRVGELTLGDHLRAIGVDPVLVGKTHMRADLEGMERLGIDPQSEIGVSVAQCGFVPFERDDGLHPYRPQRRETNYQQYLRDQGYASENPWEDFANSALGDEGELLSGWLLKYANRPANIAEEHSETPYMVRRAQEFMETADPNRPWLCHLSLIKPHWPYIVPAPYHDMYGPEHVLPAVRSEDERGQGAHPVLKSFMDARMSQAFARDDLRERVIPAYMGLIKQIDDSLGRLFDWMEETGRMDDTMIVMSSDHGDYLGDHWLGDKEHFHDCSTKIPLIVCDPRAGADATRGQAEDRLVELIDLAPTFLDFFGGEARPQNLEGRCLTPLLSGAGPDAPWRRFAVSELDYGFREVVHDLGVDADEARMTMIRDERWKYIHVLGFPPQLFDLAEDPDELKDRGREDSAEIRAVLDRFAVAHQAWASSYTRPTYSRAELDKRNLDDSEAVLIGFWDEADFEARFGKPFVKTDGRY